MIFRRILGRDDHEGLMERIGLVIHGNLGFAHGFQQAALSFWRGAVDLIGQDDVGEERARHELKRLFLAIEHGNSNDIGRQQVTGELNAFEGAVEGAREAMSQRGFADAGYVFDQKVSARQEADDGHLEHLRLAFNDLRDIVL